MEYLGPWELRVQHLVRRFSNKSDNENSDQDISRSRTIGKFRNFKPKWNIGGTDYTNCVKNLNVLYVRRHTPNDEQLFNLRQENTIQSLDYIGTKWSTR